MNIQCQINFLSQVSDSLNMRIYHDMEIHIREQIVYHNNVPIPLTHYEFQTLAYLAQHPGWVFSKEQIYEAVWKENPDH